MRALGIGGMAAGSLLELGLCSVVLFIFMFFLLISVNLRTYYLSKPSLYMNEIPFANNSFE